jgi:hypothetical protein
MVQRSASDYGAEAVLIAHAPHDLMMAAAPARREALEVIASVIVLGMCSTKMSAA